MKCIFIAFRYFLRHHQATDADSGNGSSLHFSLSSNAPPGKFVIDRVTGWIKSESLFSSSTDTLFEFGVVVKDNAGIGNYSKDTATVKVWHFP